MSRKSDGSGIDHWSFEDGADPLATLPAQENDSTEILADHYETPVSDLDGVGVDVPTEPVVVEANAEIQAAGTEAGMEPGDPDAELPPNTEIPVTDVTAENWFRGAEDAIFDLELQSDSEPVEPEEIEDMEELGEEECEIDDETVSTEAAGKKKAIKLKDLKEGDRKNVIKKVSGQAKTLAKAIVKSYNAKEQKKASKKTSKEGMTTMTGSDIFWVVFWFIFSGGPLGALIAWWIVSKNRTTKVEKFALLIEEAEDLISEIKRASAKELKSNLLRAFRGVHSELKKSLKDVKDTHDYAGNYSRRFEKITRFAEENRSAESVDDTLGIPDAVNVVNAQSVDATLPAEDDGVNVVLPEDAPAEVVTAEGLVAGDDTPTPDIVQEVQAVGDNPAVAAEGYTEDFPDTLEEVEVLVDVQGSNPEEDHSAVLATAERWFVSVESDLEGLIEQGSIDSTEGGEEPDPADKAAGKGTVEGEGAQKPVVEPQTEVEPEVPGTQPAAAQPTTEEDLDKTVESWLKW